VRDEWLVMPFKASENLHGCVPVCLRAPAFSAMAPRAL